MPLQENKIQAGWSLISCKKSSLCVVSLTGYCSCSFAAAGFVNKILQRGKGAVGFSCQGKMLIHVALRWPMFVEDGFIWVALTFTYLQWKKWMTDPRSTSCELLGLTFRKLQHNGMKSCCMSWKITISSPASKCHQYVNWSIFCRPVCNHNFEKVATLCKM